MSEQDERYKRLKTRAERYNTFKPRQRKEMVLAYLRECDEPPTSYEVAEHFGWPYRIVIGAEGALNLLEAEGLVQVIQNGREYRYMPDPDITKLMI